MSDPISIPGVHQPADGLRRGRDTVMPNWALDAMERLTLSCDNRVLVFLTRHRQYRSNTYTTRQLAIALEIDVRTIQASTARLSAEGLVLTSEGLHCAPDAGSRVRLPAQGARKVSASPLQKDSRENAENSDHNGTPSPLKKGNKEIEEASFASREQASGLIAPPEGQGPDGPAADAAPGHPTPSQDSRTGLAPVETARAPVVGARPAPIRTADPGDDADALQAFHALAGYGFCATYRLHLARWFDAYSPAFLSLAWRVAPTVLGVKVASVGFVWLLNREREWPDALKAQYERDLQPVLAPESAPVARVQPGDLLRWPDGHTATVERVDRADAVTDSPDDARGYVPLSVIGRGVEVLRS